VIRNLLFDLGGVLLDLDFDTPLKEFQELNHNGPFNDLRDFIHHPLFTGFETGSLEPDEFRDRLRQLLKNPDIQDETLDHAWCSMLAKVPSHKVGLLQKLAGRFNLFLYSNTNEIHIERFRLDFAQEHEVEWETLFKATFYSHEIKDRKPNISGYRKVLNLSGINASETLFIDDLEINTRAAAEVGLNVAHYIPGEDLEKLILQNAGIGLEGI
jgi:putative hydrolase of the HAD superfamily